MTANLERVSELFHELCKLDQAAQVRRLSEIARAEPEVHAKLQELLAGDRSADSRLEGAAVDLLSAGGEQSFFRRTRRHLPAPAPGLEPGRAIGDYRLIALLGQGGMGQVWEAEQVSLRRRVAVKFLRPGEVTEKQLELFAREARAGGRLSHPGIVSVYGYGQSEGLALIAMELVSGAWTLRAFLDEAAREETLPANHDREVARLVAEVADAMQAAHEANVIHRDLKPQNVLVTADEHPKVTDFGLARITDETALSVTGDFAGTYFYMSPEQVAARRAGLDHRTDVFSLGVVLYELLALRRPFEGDTSHQVAAQILAKDPPDIRTIRSRVPRDLAVIAGKALEKDPDKRFQTMRELAADLRRHLADEPIQARPPTRVERVAKWVKRNPAKSTAAGIAAFAFVAVSALLVALFFKSEESEIRRKLAEGNLLRALAGEELAKKNSDEALAEKERANRAAEAAKRSERLATERADDVLRLSALQRLEDLVAEADLLWPAVPENLSKYEKWLRKAGELMAELPGHVKKLAELRARSVPWTEEEQAKHRAEHPKLAEFESAKRHRRHYEELRAALESSAPSRDPTPEEVGLDPALLPTTADEANYLAWPLVDPDRKDWGGEAKGLVLARRAVELAAELSADARAGIRDTLAWALFANGRFDEAVAEEEQALEEAPDKKPEFEGYLSKLKKKIEEELDPAKESERAQHLVELEQTIAALEAEISTRHEWLFADAQDKWWHNQLEKLVSGLESFADEKAGLFSDVTSPEHGWGIPKRAEFARTIAERSTDGSKASAKWAEAVASIADARECPLYCGLRITPQLGLLPIGRDPASGLWEFAHFQTGEPAVRRPDGKVILKEETGLVFVLLPGGTFRMGAQSVDPTAENHDPQAADDQGPVHAVTLTPFFLSKYEMTQGQWSRFVGSNPSYFAPGQSSAKTRITLLHPVEQVSWTTCDQELRRLCLELPSEARWEYACRAGTSTPWSTGDTLESLRGYANIADEGSADSYAKGWNFERGFSDAWDVHCPVGALLANAFGLHEMHGNVWEWCLDGYQGGFYREGPQRDPVSDPAGSANRVDRGGGFFDLAVHARSAVRIHYAPSYADVTLGLRPARALLAP